MFATRFEALGQLSPGAHWMMSTAATFALALAAAHWMVDWIHRHAANMRTLSQPSTPTRFAAGNVHVFNIADLSNRGVSILVDPPDFA